MKQCSHELQLASLIPPASNYNPVHYSHLDGLFQDMLADHMRLEEKLYQAVTLHKDTAKNSKKEEIQDRIDDVRLSSRALVRFMGKLGIDKRVGTSRLPLADGVLSFISTFDKMIELTEESLYTSAEEAKTKEEELRETVARYRQATGDLKSLQTDIATEQQQGDSQLKERDMDIDRLTNDIARVKMQSDQMRNEIESSHHLKCSTAEHTHHSAYEALVSRIAKLEKELASLKEQHKEEEAGLRKKNLKLYQEVQAWIGKFDTDMQKMTDELESINQKMSTDQPRLEFLEEELGKFDAVRREREDVARKKEEETEAVKRHEERRSRAATVIQALYRGHRIRHPIQKKAKGGSKDKKGDGKDKKKKKKK